MLGTLLSLPVISQIPRQRHRRQRQKLLRPHKLLKVAQHLLLIEIRHPRQRIRVGNRQQIAGIGIGDETDHVVGAEIEGRCDLQVAAGVQHLGHILQVLQRGATENIKGFY